MKNNNLFKNKNVVTIIASVLIVLVLIIGYNYRVNSAVAMQSVPYAREMIGEKTEITEGMLDVMRVPRNALSPNVIYDKSQIIKTDGTKYYTRVNTIIPSGSLLYWDTVVKQDNLPDASLYLLGKDEKLNYITVNMLSSYSNSIRPNQYIDIYAAFQHNGENKVAKLFSNVKVLTVKTSNGLNVFENENEKRVPYVVFFGMPAEEDMLLKKIQAINSWGGGTGEEGAIRTTQITLTPIPTAATDVANSDKLSVKISSPEMSDEIDRMVDDLTADEYKYDNGNKTQNNSKTDTNKDEEK